MHEPSRRALVANPDGRAEWLSRIVDPLLDAYGTAGERAALGRAIHSFDIINEPDWVTSELAPNDHEPLTLDELRAFVRATGDRLRTRSGALITLGGGRVKFAAE